MKTTLISATDLDSRTQLYRDSEGLLLSSGERLARFELAYRTWGALNESGDNAVLVCHALTGSADVDQWWPGLIASGGALDPDQDFIICSNVLGGCYGSSGPLHPARDGIAETLGMSFPAVSVRDMVHAQQRLLSALGVRRIKLVIGPSLGGMQVLEWAASFPNQVERIAPIGTSARHSAWCIGISESQRAAIETDPLWRQGRYRSDAPPAQGLSTARMMAMLSYRSFENFETRFAREAGEQSSFSVQDYLRYQGRKLVERFDAASYVRLTEAMDQHDIGIGRGGTEAALSAIDCPALVISVSSDILYPPAEQAFIAEHLPDAELRELDSAHGHDGFLIETGALSSMVRAFRRRTADASAERLSA